MTEEMMTASLLAVWAEDEGGLARIAESRELRVQ